jgi:hypothetical protein
VRNRFFVLLLLATSTAFAASAAQHVAIHPRPNLDTGDQATIREILDMERQARDASRDHAQDVAKASAEVFPPPKDMPRLPWKGPTTLSAAG